MPGKEVTTTLYRSEEVFWLFKEESELESELQIVSIAIKDLSNTVTEHDLGNRIFFFDEANQTRCYYDTQKIILFEVAPLFILHVYLP